ncbi:MAG: sulfotransferase domain-containing protein [Acetobacteraceae bacterium]|nr:sulfotransferase domain-containing protein [Acetobacteraceae bacterium]
MGKLVWLASYPKSGSTWLRAFLHNFILQPDEPYRLDALSDLTVGESGADHYKRYDPRPASQYAVADVQRMRPRVHRDLTAVSPTLVFAKTHNASLVVEGVPLVTPEVTAGAIYMVRDPRDIAVSFSHHIGRSIDETIAIMADPEAATGGDDRRVYERLSSWSLHVHYWTRRPDPRLLVLRYEDMLADPARAFGDVIRLLGMDPPADRLERAIRFSRFEALRDQEATRGFAERPSVATAPFFRTGGAGGWRDVLTPTQAARIERDHGTQMQLFGYIGGR